MEKGNDARWPRGARVAYVRLSLCVAIAAIAASMALPGGPAFAQEIVASINGDPITNIDIDERIKMLRVLRKPATRDAAIRAALGAGPRLDAVDARPAPSEVRRRFAAEPAASAVLVQSITVGIVI